MYKKAVVSFIDILGFRKLLDLKTPEEIYNILRTTQFHLETPERRVDQFVETIVFSDSVIRVRWPSNQDEVNNPGATIANEIMTMFNSQIELVTSGIFIRGSISYGDIYFQRSVEERQGDQQHRISQTVFGPSIVEAYDLESKRAIYPRLIIALKAKELLDMYLLDPDAETWRVGDERIGTVGIRDILSRGDDGIWFVDYLNQHPNWGTFAPFLTRHKYLIEKKLKEFKTYSKEWVKYS